MRNPHLDAAQVDYITSVESNCRIARGKKLEEALRISFEAFQSEVQKLLAEMFVRKHSGGLPFVELSAREVGILDRYMMGPSMYTRWTEVHGENRDIKGRSLASAYAHFRSGNVPGTEIVPAEAFDEAINIIYDDLFAHAISRGVVTNPDQTICVFLWRAACSAIESAYRSNFRHALHLGVSRNEHTGNSSAYYVGDGLDKALDSNTDVLLVDPMFATGGTMQLAIDHLHKLGVPMERMSIASVISAAPGVARVLSAYPIKHAIVGKSDGSLNEHVFIAEPGAGDAGDKAARAFTVEKQANWLKLGMMGQRDAIAFVERMEKTIGKAA